jgi:hypothetical protein
VSASNPPRDSQKAWSDEVETRRTALLADTESGCANQLARFFPEAESVQVQAILKPLRNGSGKVRETVMVEFASAANAIFASTLPLEFDDLVWLEDPRGRWQSQAMVVAVQYHEGQMAVAVQFVNGQCAWVNRP